jgi:hypothetical protein
MKMNSKDIQLVKKEYETKYDFRCTDEAVQELIDLANNDVAMVIRTIQRTKKHYKLKEFIQSNAQQTAQKVERKKIVKTGLDDQFRRKYEPVLDEGVIDQDDWNFLVRYYHEEDKPERYKVLQYRVQLWWAKQLRQVKPETAAIQGILPDYWQNYAFSMLAVEQKQELDMNLINTEAQRYKAAWSESETFKRLSRGDVRPILLGMGM